MNGTKDFALEQELSIEDRTKKRRIVLPGSKNEVFCWRVRATRAEVGAAQRWRGPEGAPCAVS